jgi:hypothetical protein
VVKVVPPKEFIDQVRAAEAAVIVEARLNKMKFNLSKKDYDKMFDQWNQIRQETAQRLQRIEQYHNKYQEQQLRRSQQLQQKQHHHQQRQLEKPTESSTKKDVVIRNLEMMKRVVSGSGSGNSD